MGGEPWFEETKYAELLRKEILTSAHLKRFDVLAFQIMPNHVHVLVIKRTLESVRLGINKKISTERTFSKVREYNISHLMQSIRGNFSRKVDRGNLWQRRFYTKIIDTPRYLETIIEYMHCNPVKENLLAKYERAPYRYTDTPSISALF